MQHLLRASCERVAEKLYNAAATLNLARPPDGVLSWEQQAQLYLSLKANPLGLIQMKLEHGDEKFAAWVETMEYRLGVLGKIGVNVADMAVEEKENILSEDVRPPTEEMSYE